MATTAIPYCEDVWNPLFGCQPISPGCANCWAAAMARRLAGMGHSKYAAVVDANGWNKRTIFDPYLSFAPAHWHRPRRIFVCSMSDFFYHRVDLTAQLMLLDVMQLADHHTYLLLTKRPDIMCGVLGTWLDEHDLLAMPDHIHIGVTVENQHYADERIPLLLSIPAAVHWISAEPLLGPIDLRHYLTACSRCGTHLSKLDTSWRWTGRHWEHKCPDLAAYYGHFAASVGLDWVVAGAESGPNRRPYDINWAMTLYRQCTDAGVPFWYKQGSGPRPGHDPELPGIGPVRQLPHTNQ